MKPRAKPRTPIPAALLLLAVALVATTASGQPAPSSSAAAGSLHIHVRGTAELSAIASAEPSGFSLRGELIDDAGSPIPSASIALQAFAAEDAATPLRLGPLQPCDASTWRLVKPSPGAAAGGEDTIVTDERGSFCVIGKAPAPKLLLKLRFKGSKVHDATEMQVAVESEHDHLLHTVLRFEPPPETIDLERESVTVTASLRVDRTEAMRRAAGLAGSARREGLALVLEDEKGKQIADAVTGGDGRARFEVKTAELAGPGTGELVVRFAGNQVLAKAVATQPIVRRAEVRLALVHPIERGDSEDGIAVDVEVTTSRGPIEGGVVEVRRSLLDARGVALGSSEGVGAGAVVAGRAHAVAAFPTAGARRASLAIRFVPAAPWHRAGPELHVDVELSRPGVVREVLLAIVVLGAAAWVVGGWRRAPKPRVAPGVDPAAAPPSGRPGVHVLGPSVGFAGWRGVVRDAHDGAPVPGARLAILAPAFAGDGVMARVVADENGAFEIEAAHRSDARLLVESDEHSAHEQALPPPCTLGVALVTRRRALLERLVRWAKRQGAPFDGAPEPTPGHVRRAAGRANAQAVEAWARRVEEAAYGSDPVGEGLEREVRAAEPRPAPGAR